MKKVSAALVLIAAVVLSGRASGQAANGTLKAGQIIIVGNEITRQEVILEAIAVFPGQVVRQADLRAAERRLRKLEIFATDLPPTVTLLDLEKEGEFKDVLVTVRETVTSSLRLAPGVTSTGELVVSLVWEERNFDPRNWPTSMAECTCGKAFKGAGQLLRVELLELRVFPGGSPRLFRWNSLPFAPCWPGLSVPVDAAELVSRLVREK